MCGIFGYVSSEDHRPWLEKAGPLQSHRGPDNWGTWQTQMAHHYVGLAHQRLAIIGLEKESNQPFVDSSGRYRLVYNGEVYNYVELKEELEQEGCRFRTSSDTEVLLQALLHWGLDRALEKFNGMWAFAWLDQREGQLVLCRDRVGIKPLYYHGSTSQLIFASEIKTILALKSERSPLNPQIVGEYLSQQLLEAHKEETFFADIFKVPAGSYLKINLNKPHLTPQKYRYYRLQIKKQTPLPFLEAVERFKYTLEEAVALRLRSDVPVGLMLSGGLDSSTLATISYRIAGHRGSPAPQLFSVVSEDPLYDESPFIHSVARFLGTQTETVQLSTDPQFLLSQLSHAHWHNDEPVTSFSSVAHMLTMKRAKELGLTVILNGQGADEYLGGYKKFLAFQIQWLLRQGRGWQALKLIHEFRKNESILPQFSYHDAKRYMPSWLRRKEINILGPALQFYQRLPVGMGNLCLEERMQKDIESLSVPALLHGEDRMSMSSSRELRVPFLDHRLIEMGLQWPPEYRFRQGWTKFILREAYQKELPKDVLWRKDKKGFTLPQGEWLKKELQSHVQKVFSGSARMYDLGLVDQKMLLKKYDLFVRQKPEQGNISFKDIFAPLALENWLGQFGDRVKG